MKKVSRVNKNFILYSLCLGVALFFAFSVYKSGRELFHYLQLSESALAKIDHFTSRETKKNHYQIWASGTFSYQGSTYQITAPLAIYYPNPWAAEARIGRMEKEEKIELPVWFSKQRIEEALFIRTFPLHSLISSGILAGILLYFSIIALYMRKKGYSE